MPIMMRRPIHPEEGDLKSWAEKDAHKRSLEALCARIEDEVRSEAKHQGEESNWVSQLSIAVTFYAFDEPDVEKLGWWRLIGFANIWNPVPLHGRHLSRASKGIFKSIKDSKNNAVKFIQPDDSESSRGFAWREDVRCHVRFTLVKDGRKVGLLFVNFCGVDPRQMTHPDRVLTRLKKAIDESELLTVCDECANQLSDQTRLAKVVQQYVVSLHAYYSLSSQRGAAESEGKPVSIIERHRENLKEVLGAVLKRVAQILMEKAEPATAIWGSIRAIEIHDGEYFAVTRASYHSRKAKFDEGPERMPFREEGGNEQKGMGLIVWGMRYEHPLLISDFGDTGCVQRCWKNVYQSTPGEEHPASEVVIPIVLDTGELWGALNLEADKGMAFRPADVDFLLLCARLLGVFIHEHMRWLTYEYATNMLRELTHGERQDGELTHRERRDRDRAVIPKSLAKLLQEHLSATEVTVAPWGESFFPICDPLIYPPTGNLYYTRPKGLSRVLAQDSYKPTSVHEGGVEDIVLSGLWINTHQGTFSDEDATWFQVHLGSGRTIEHPRPPPGLQDVPKAELGRSEANTLDQNRQTRIGMPIYLRAPGNTAESENKPAAICWIKYQGRVPFFKIKAYEIAQLLQFLSIHLWHHRAVRTVPGFGGRIFTREALEGYLDHARQELAKRPCDLKAAALVDMDDLRGMNYRHGYVTATSIINCFVRRMIKACEVTRKEFEEKGVKDRSIYADIFKYGGDEFVILIRSEESLEQSFVTSWVKKWNDNFRALLGEKEVGKEEKDGESGDLSSAWRVENPRFSCGVTHDLSSLLNELRNIDDKERIQAARWLLDHLALCLRTAKIVGKDTLIAYEDMKLLINASLYEYYPEGWKDHLIAKIEELKTRDLGEHRWPIQVVEVVSGSSVVLSIGGDVVRPRMRFRVVTDVSSFTRAEGDGHFDPRFKAELEVTEVWQRTCLARVLLPGGPINLFDNVVLQRE